MRVSIVATALDGQVSENKTVLNMVDRIQNRNAGYTDSWFSKNTTVENTTYNSIDGATALKLDEEFNPSTENLINSESEMIPETVQAADPVLGISIESASYMENNIPSNEQTQHSPDNNLMNSNTTETEKKPEEEYTPQLFADENIQVDERNFSSTENIEEQEKENIFNQDLNEEEDFEIPAFLRRQKF